jgi:drug/metabolite transporter (DMT)-like permease
MMERHRRALWELNIAGVLFGFTAQFSYLIPLGADTITFWRVVFAAIATLMFIVCMRIPLRIASWREGAVMFAAGALMCVHWVTYFHAMQVAGVVVGLIALFTYPVITVFVEPWFFKERIHWVDVVIAFYVFAGIWLVVPQFSAADPIAEGVFWGVVSAICYTLRVMLQKKYVQHYPGTSLMFYQLLASIILLLIGTQMVVPAHTSEWSMLALAGVLFTAIPHILTVRSLSALRAKTVGIISCIQLVYGAALAMLLAHERPSWQTWVGGAIVMSAGIIESRRAGRTKH